MARERSPSALTNEYRTFLKVLVLARRASGLTQRQLAEKIHRSNSYIAKCELGDQRMDIYQIRQYLKGIEIPFVDFMQQYDKAVDWGMQNNLVRPDTESQPSLFSIFVERELSVYDD